ncbi:FecCD family ABC transporter permease [Acidimangrovimonas sediminis]|uniref:FecCD family ABC transporter permease n=1 Tax=Acidimangrovimonas sediminis TaxID=2056283 RepID=UPI000C805EAF|nr:iron ABC transporter permease [Acidimangrovimonas sediminis]
MTLSVTGAPPRPARPRPAAGDRRDRARLALIALACGLVLVALLALGTGPLGLSPWRVLEVLRAGPQASVSADSLVIWQIRLPRLLLGLAVGAGLATSGALMQGLFRNPLADPGLIGVSAGAALAAIATIVLGTAVLSLPEALLQIYALPLAAFGGALVNTLLLYAIATRRGQTSVATLLLGGIAIGAAAGALSGLLIYKANDTQLRDFTFWSMGGLGGATWGTMAVCGLATLSVVVAAPFFARGMNAVTLGEAQAYHLGVDVQRLKRRVIVLVALSTGAAVAASGMIGFVGLVVPHLLRLVIGPDHRGLLPASALLGALLLVLADMVARSVVAPAELPIGIVTAAVGAPFFLWLLLRRRGGIGG